MSQKGESNPFSDSKFQRFAGSIERTLKAFDFTKQWQEVISCLVKLHKVLLAYTHFKIVPHKHLICKHLSQCLHPNLPGTVHLKVLEIYKVIFDRIGRDGLSRDLFLYCSGLYPLFDYTSIQVRPQLLELYEQYLLPLGPGLLPGLQGFVMAVLPGLEEGSECVQRVTSLLDNLSSISLPGFTQTLWNILHHTPSLRQPTADYMFGHLSKGKSQLSQMLKRIEEHSDTVVQSLCSSLEDVNVSIVRRILDLITLLLPLNNTTISLSQFTMVTTAMLITLTKRDNSLNRRVYSWLLGNVQQNSPITSQPAPNTEDGASMYFTSFIYPRLTAAIKSTLVHVDINVNSKTFDKTKYLSTHRLLKALSERTELHEVLLELMPDYIMFLRHQMNLLDACVTIEKKRDPSDTTYSEGDRKCWLRKELYRTVNQFLCGLNREMLWKWIKESLINDVTTISEHGVDMKQMILTLLQFLPQQNSEPIVSSYLPILIHHYSDVINNSFISIPLDKLSSVTSFSLSLLNLLNQFIHALNTGKTTFPLTSTDNISILSKSLSNSRSRHTCITGTTNSTNTPLDTPTHILPPSDDGEGTTPEVYTSLLKHLENIFVSSLNLLNRFTMVYIAKLGDCITSKDHFVDAMKKVADINNGDMSCDNGEIELEDIFKTLCEMVTQSLNMIISITGVLSDTAYIIDTPSSMTLLYGLLLSCLCTGNVHMFIIALSTLVTLWNLEKEITGDNMKGFIEILTIDFKSKKEFIKLMSVFLWDMLSQLSLNAHHDDVSFLLYELHSLSLPATNVEDIILEKFAIPSVVPYQTFLVFWKQCLMHCDTTSLKRLLLRVLEGLQSTDPSISQCCTLWINILSETKQLSKVLLPLYNLITEVTPPKRLPQYESPRTPKSFHAHAQYYFASAILKEDEPVKEDTPPYPMFYFTQIVDAPRLQYGMSLFLSLLAIDPVAICTHLALAYMDHSSGYSSPINPTTEYNSSPRIHFSDAGRASDMSRNSTTQRSGRPQRLHSSVAKSLLELVLTHCSHILLTDYSTKLDIAITDMTALTNIKIIAVNLLVDILECIMSIVSGKNRQECTNGSNLTNSTYILCLLALCEVQKSTILGLLQLIDIFKHNSSPNDTELKVNKEKSYSGSYSLHVSLPHLQPLFVQLLKALYYGICLESMATNIAESPMSMKKAKRDQHLLEEKTFLSYVPGTSIVMQPLFFHILNSILSRSHLVLQQTYLLSVIVHSMSHYRDSLEIIAPKILKQIYRNLKELLSERDATKNHAVSPDHAVTHDHSVQPDHTAKPEHVTRKESEGLRRTNSLDVVSWDNNNSHVKICQSDELIALYMRTISHIVHYCLLRSSCKELSTKTDKPVLHFQLTDPLWSIQTFELPSTSKNFESSNGSPMTAPIVQEKAGFSFGWLFGGVFNGYSDTEPDKQAAENKPEYCGVYAPVGQKVLWQLQHVYGVVVRVWKESLSNNEEINSALKNDLNILVKQFFQPMIEHDSVLFYTTVAQTWMHWNLVGRSKQNVKESFIRLLHSYKLQSLEELLGSISDALGSMKESHDDVSKDRQKYILHFLLYYLSSPLQSIDELTNSFSTIVTFLKDSHDNFATGMDYNSSCHTSLVCMLTSILHLFVHRVPVPDIQINKKQRKELQDIIYKMCETLSLTADNNIIPKLHTYQNQLTIQTNGKSITDKTSLKAAKGVVNHHHTGLFTVNDCEIQALSMLSNVMSRFIDSVYNDEKDKVSYLLKTVLKPVWTTLKSYSPPTVYGQAVKLLLSVSEFEITRRYWRDEVMELLLEPLFFTMDKNSIYNWKTIINNLVSHDKTVFNSILNRISLSSVSTQQQPTGMVSMYASIDQERKHRSKILKRIAFVILCGEHNQYIGHIHDISGKLSDCVQYFSCPTVCTQVLLTLRVLMVKVSADGLVSLWPIVINELTSALIELQSDLGIELATPQPITKDKLLWYWSACRILETLVSLPHHILPHWQFISWGYFGALFGASLEQDIGETTNSTQGDLRDVPTPLVNGRKENESNKEMSTASGVHRGIPNDRWSLIDDILQIYKDHTHDMKLVKLSTHNKLPLAYKVNNVTQLVGFLHCLCAREISDDSVVSGRNKMVPDETSAINELTKIITFDFID